MKVPHINSVSINHAVDLTVKSGKRILKDTKKCVDYVGMNSRNAITAVVVVSSSLNPNFVSKSVEMSPRFHSEGDVFVHSTRGVVKDLVKARKSSIKRPAAKIPVINSAKDVLLTTTSSSKSSAELNNALNDILLKKNLKTNPIKNKAGVFIAKADKYRVNPVLLMAISMAESSRGTSTAAITKNNIGGIMGRHGLRKFTKVDDCIEIMAETISKHHNDSKINTLEELGYSGKYCNKAVAKEWIKHVMFYIKKLSQ